jgi:hypothetical protein
MGDAVDIAEDLKDTQIQVAVNSQRIITLENGVKELKTGQDEIIRLLKNGFSARLMVIEQNVKAITDQRDKTADFWTGILKPIMLDTLKFVASILIVIVLIHIPEVGSLFGLP